MYFLIINYHSFNLLKLFTSFNSILSLYVAWDYIFKYFILWFILLLHFLKTSYWILSCLLSLDSYVSLSHQAVIFILRFYYIDLMFPIHFLFHIIFLLKTRIVLTYFPKMFLLYLNRVLSYFNYFHFLTVNLIFTIPYFEIKFLAIPQNLY